MNPFKVIWLKAGVAFGIPFFTALGIALEPFSTGDSAQPNVAGWLIIICAPLVAGFSGLGSFLSTTFAEHKAKTEAGLDDSAPAPITQAQAAAPSAVSFPYTVNTSPVGSNPSQTKII
jgi:hypothetical protein